MFSTLIPFIALVTLFQIQSRTLPGMPPVVDPQTIYPQYNIATPTCVGVNHADFSMDGLYAFFTCEFAGGGLIKIDLVQRKVVANMRLTHEGGTVGHSMPQDMRISPDGKVLFV